MIPAGQKDDFQPRKGKKKTLNEIKHHMMPRNCGTKKKKMKNKAMRSNQNVDMIKASRSHHGRLAPSTFFFRQNLNEIKQKGRERDKEGGKLEVE